MFHVLATRLHESTLRCRVRTGGSVAPTVKDPKGFIARFCTSHVVMLSRAFVALVPQQLAGSQQSGFQGVQQRALYVALWPSAC